MSDNSVVPKLNRGGRVPLGEEKKTKPIQVKFTPKEYAYLAEAIKNEGCTEASEYVRRALQSYLSKDVEITIKGKKVSLSAGEAKDVLKEITAQL